MSQVRALYHIVFCTKSRKMTITDEFRRDLYSVIFSVIQKNNCHLIRMGGIANHIHMLLDLNPQIALSHLMRIIKSESSGFLKRDKRFPLFEGWGTGYFAMTISPEIKDNVINYINNQQNHHYIMPFDQELEQFFREACMEFDENELS